MNLGLERLTDPRAERQRIVERGVEHYRRACPGMSSSSRIYPAATSFRCYSNITSSVTSSLTAFCKVAIPLPSPHPVLPGSFTLLYFSSVAFITSWHTMFISGSICFLAAYPHCTEHELHEGRGIVYFVHCFSSTPIAGPGTLWYLIYVEWMNVSCSVRGWNSSPKTPSQSI